MPEILRGWKRTGTIIANPIAVSSAGDKSRVSLRPERVSINPNDQFENRFSAEIKEIIYHGDHTRVRVNSRSDDYFKSTKC